jgi:hypothetical protein
MLVILDCNPLLLAAFSDKEWCKECGATFFLMQMCGIHISLLTANLKSISGFVIDIAFW